MKEFHLHLVSDATGETVQSVARACMVQFDHVKPVEHLWTLVRNEKQIKTVIEGIRAHPGFVLYTLVNDEIRSALEDACRRQQVPCISVLQTAMDAFSAYLKTHIHARPGRQHTLDNDYYHRIEAMDYALSHDDGQAVWNLDEADVVIVGVSRTSKTPTCVYLANRGIKAANVPIVLGAELPPEVFELEGPLVVGLVKDPKNLVQIRKNRLRLLANENDSEYANPDTVAQEVKFANRVFANQGWPVIDVTRRSIEETAAAILQLRSRRLEQKA